MPTNASNKRTGKKSPKTRGQKKNKMKGSVSAPAASNRSSGHLDSKRQRYRESERIGTVNGSVAFSNVLTFHCNPGLAESFPWLSGHAKLYENYRVRSITYRFKNLKGANTDGNIIMSFDYDTTDSAPKTAVEATQSTVYKDGAPWRIFTLTVPTDGRTLFTRTGPVVGDIKMSDMGVLYVSAEGCANATAHGYLEVDYDIEFLNKQTDKFAGNAAPAIGSVNILSLASDMTVVTGTVYPAWFTVYGTPNSAMAHAFCQVNGDLAAAATFHGFQLAVGVYKLDTHLLMTPENTIDDNTMTNVSFYRVKSDGTLPSVVEWIRPNSVTTEVYLRMFEINSTVIISVTDPTYIYGVRILAGADLYDVVGSQCTSLACTYLGQDPSIIVNTTLNTVFSVADPSRAAVVATVPPKIDSKDIPSSSFPSPPPQPDRPNMGRTTVSEEDDEEYIRVPRKKRSASVPRGLSSNDKL